jgi:hypothetical protein
VSGPYRVLKIRNGETKDADGREVGTDWLVATLGADADDFHYYVTTDRVRGSELADVAEICKSDPGDLARAIARMLNARWTRDVRRRQQRRLNL